MIETTYVRLAQAAAMLDTDTDTLLIAAYEGRLRLHGLLNQFRKAEKRAWDEDWEGNKFSYPIEEKQMWFWMVPVDRHGAGYLMQAGYAAVNALSENDDQGRYWTDADPFARDPAQDRIPLAHVFLKRAEVESIKAAHATPAPDTIKDAPQRRSIPRDNSLICTLAALLAAWPGGAIPSGKDLEKAAQSLGLTLSDDTIRKALKAAQEAAPSLPLPK